MIGENSNRANIIKYRDAIQHHVREYDINWRQQCEPCVNIEDNKVPLSKIINELRMIGVDLKMPNIWTTQYNVWLEIGSEIVRQINEYLDFTKRVFIKYIPLYLPIIISVVSLVISIFVQ